MRMKIWRQMNLYKTTRQIYNGKILKHFFGNNTLRSWQKIKEILRRKAFLVNLTWKTKLSCFMAANLRISLSKSWFNASVSHSGSDMGRLHHKHIRLRLLATCSITITNKQNNNLTDYDYTESNHDYNRDYICLETFSERKQKPISKVSCKYIFRQHTILRNAVK